MQLNINNAFGCDTGVFIEIPAAGGTPSTTYNTVFSANKQLDVSDSANTGVVDIGHSTGTVVDGHFTQSLSSTFVAPGYGIDWPDAQPSAANQALRTVGSSPGADGRWATQWAASGNGVSLEYLYPLDYTNAPAPTQSNDLIRTLFAQGQDSAFMGPLPPTDPRSAVIQDKLCTMGDTPTCSGGGTTISCTTSSAGPSYVHCQFSIDQPIQPGDTGYVEFAAICGLGCTGNTHTLSDTAGNTWTQMTNADGSGSSVPAASYWSHMVPGATTFSVDFDNTGSLFTYRGFFHFVELRGTVTPDGTGYNGSGVSGPPTFQSVTTANATDTILGSLYQFNCAGTYTAGSGFGIINQFSGTVNTSDHISFGAEAENVSATGTYTPTITPTCGASLGSAFTQAFTQSVYGGPAKPSFRFIKYVDLVAGLDFPTQSGNTGKCLASSGGDTSSLNWVACGTSGTVTNVSGTTNQIDVATGTTTPVLSLSSTLIFPGTITMGAHNADFSAATLFKIPVGAGATSSADGVIAYDSTAKSTHLRTNAADSIAAAFASAPAGSKCLHTNGTTGLVTETATDCSSSSLAVAGSSGDVQMNNGAGNLGAAHINDNATTITTTEPLLVGGILDGYAPVAITTSTPVTLGATYKSGYTYNQHATAATAITYNLPTAAAGLQYCVANSYNGSAADTGTLTLQTSAAGQYIIFNDGTLSASGGYVISGGAGGDAGCVVGVDSTHWQFYAQGGTWAKH